VTAVADVDPLARVVFLLGALGAMPVWFLARGVARWLSNALTATIVRARLSGWRAILGRFLCFKLPAVSTRNSGRDPITAGPDVPLDSSGPAVLHLSAVSAWPERDPERTVYLGPLVRPYADPTWRPAWQRHCSARVQR
jgi:hypothetical protein